MDSNNGETDRDVLLLKQMIDVRKHFLNARKCLLGNILGDDLSSLMAMHICVDTALAILEVDLDSDTAHIGAKSSNDSMEIKWVLDEYILPAYKKRYKRVPGGVESVILLFRHHREVKNTLTMPSRPTLDHLLPGIERFLGDISEDVFGTPLKYLDYHLILKDKEMSGILSETQDFLLKNDHKQSILRSSFAFSISLEKMRQRLNYLLERDELSTHFFSLDTRRTLYFKLQDYSFLLLAMEVNMDKYRLFIKIVPTTLIDESGNEGVSVTFSDYIQEKWLTTKWARFCFNFVMETLLHWESMELSSPKR